MSIIEAYIIITGLYLAIIMFDKQKQNMVQQIRYSMESFNGNDRIERESI